MIRIEPATAEHFAKLTGAPPATSARAITALRDGEVLGIAGLYRQGAGMVMFSTLTPPLLADKRTIVRGIRKLMEWARAGGTPVWALADGRIPGSATLLEHIGFRHDHGEVYTWRK